jgi:hypothetical protein
VTALAWKTGLGEGSDFKTRPATLAECATAELCPYPAGPKFSLRGAPRKVIEAAIEAMEADARNRLEMVREMKRQLKSGEIPTSETVGFCVVSDSTGERLTEVFPVYRAAEVYCDWDKHSVCAMCKDGTTHPIEDRHGFFTHYRHHAAGLPLPIR